MFEFISVEHPDQVKFLIDQFSPLQSTWIVSDLKSKKTIQTKCLEQYGYYSDDAILRISDFWRLWLRRLEPQMQVVSQDFIRILVKQYVEDFGKQLNLEKQEATTLIRYVNDLAPLLLHPDSQSSLQEWFSKKVETKSWQKWFILAQSCIKYIVNDRQTLDAKWIVSFLQGSNLKNFSWPRDILVDLGSEMTSVEMGLLKILSQKTKVTILVPSPHWKNKFRCLLRTYQDYEGFSKKNTLPPMATEMQTLASAFQRFSTELAEIKFITMQIRQWIDQGIEPHQIALISPRVEEYWSILKMHLTYEGIPTDKDTVVPFMGLGLIQNLLSKLKTESDDPTWESLEVSVFKSEDNARQYEKFKALFSELTDAEDFHRDENIKNIFYKKIDYSKKMTRPEFLAAVLTNWLELDKNEQSFELLEPVFKNIISKTTNISLSFFSWLEVFSSLLARQEHKIERAPNEGIQVRPLNASHLMTVTHRIWFGLDEGGLRSKGRSLIPISDIEELKKDFDLALDYPEESHAEFNLYWLSKSLCKEQIFTTAHVSMQSDPLNTPLFILENNIKPDVTLNPETRLDQVQKNQTIEAKLQRDLSGGENKILNFHPNSFSSSDLINYAQCEFKLLATKGFKLRDYAATSVDLDPRQKGTLVHALFEWLIQEDRYKKIVGDELAQFLDHKRRELGLYPSEDVYWLSHKKRFSDMAMKFAKFETERLKSWPLSRLTHMTEVDFNLLFDDFKVSGRIDRVDYSPATHEAVIYDYKSSNSTSTNYAKSWLEKLEYQMLFYMLALESTLLPGAQTKGAFYYFYKKMSVYKGFVQDSAAEIQVLVDFKKNALMSTDEKTQLMSDFKTALQELFQKIKQGLYTALPVDTKICSDCDWRKLCRAPHLN